MNAAEVEKIRRELNEATDPVWILAELDRLERCVSQEISSIQDIELHYHGLRTLRRTLPDEAPLNADIVVKRLLPLCVRQVQDSGGAEERLLIYRCRELAEDWVNSIERKNGEKAISDAVDCLCVYLQSPLHWRGACWTIQAIGYRAEALENALWDVVKTGGEAERHLALRTLATLGLSGEQKERCLNLAIAAAGSRLTSDLLSVFAAIPDPRSVQVLLQSWLSRNSVELESHKEDLLSALVAVGRGLEEDSDIDAAIGAISTLYDRLEGSFGRRLRLAGDVCSRLDSPESMRLLLRLMVDGACASEYDLWLAMHRLEECYLPRMLNADAIIQEYSEPLKRELKKVLFQSGTYEGRESTLPGDLKILALQTAFCLGLLESEEWLEEILANEVSPYLNQEVLEQYAVFKISPLPDPLHTWISGERDVDTNLKGSGELLYGMSATRVARSAETWEAFDVLSRPGLTMNGSVLVETVDALVAASICVGKNIDDRERMIHRLFEIIEKPTSRAQLSAGCRALGAIARHGWLNSMAARVVGLLRVEPKIALEAHDRSELIGAVVALPEGVITESAVTLIASWGRERDDVLGERAIRALIELRRSDEFMDWLAPKLGLSESLDGYDWRSELTDQVTGSPYLVVLLYAQSKEAADRFTKALCSVLHDRQWFVRYDAVAALLRFVLRGEASLNDRVREALVDRAKMRQNSRQSDPEILIEVAMLAPEHFIQQTWPDLWPDWLSESRVGLADALGNVFAKFPMDPRSTLAGPRWRAATHLLRLVSDSSFAVRRAACRALSKVSSSMLAQRCIEYSESNDTHQRVLAAELLSWIAEIPEVTIGADGPTFLANDYAGVGEHLLGDRSERVRKAARDSIEAKKKRTLASIYCSRLLANLPQTNAEMFALWRLGQALTIVGDEESVRRLRDFLVVGEISPNVRYWLVRILKRIEKRWGETKKGWPGATLATPGDMEMLNGSINWESRDIEVECTLWHISSVSPEEGRKWGGFAVTKSFEEGIVLSSAIGKVVPFVTPGHATTQIVLNMVGLGGHVGFRGVGDYPRVLT